MGVGVGEAVRAPGGLPAAMAAQDSGRCIRRVSAPHPTRPGFRVGSPVEKGNWRRHTLQVDNPLSVI